MTAITATPIAVAHRDEGALSRGISASATTVYVGAIYKYIDGVKTRQGFDTTGGFAEIMLADRYELISFGAKSVDATTKETTLTDVRRGLAVNSTTATFTAGTGIVWPKGATIRVVASAQYFQGAAYKDLANTFTQAQVITAPLTVSGTTSYIKIPSLTEAERDLLSASNGMVIYNTTTGRLNTYEGGAWGVSSATTVADASTTVAGKVEIATDAEIRAETGAGGTGALLAIPASATAVLKDDRIVLKDATELTIASGAITVTQPYHSVDTEGDAASDDLDTITAAVGVGEIIVLVANNTGRTVVIKHNTGNVKLADATDFSLDDTEKSITLLKQTGNWIEIARGKGAVTPTFKWAPVQAPIVTDSAAAATSNNEVYFDTHTYTIPANELVSGTAFRCTVSATNTHTSGSLNFVTALGSTDIASAGALTATSTDFVAVVTLFGTAGAGASVAVRAVIEFQMGTTLVACDYGTANVATNGTLVWKFGMNNTGVDSAVMHTSLWEKGSTTAF